MASAASNSKRRKINKREIYAIAQRMEQMYPLLTKKKNESQDDNSWHLSELKLEQIQTYSN